MDNNNLANRDESEICNFYKDKTIFLTGGTGFMGKIFIEKLLRTTDVAMIYILIREKRGKNLHVRMDELLNNIVICKTTGCSKIHFILQAIQYIITFT